jgi:hypothetical protein
MMELHDRLDRLAGPAAPATEEQATADLARGRRALRRRRTVKGAATGVFAVAAAVAALAYGAASRPGPAPHPAVATAALVAYKGEQPQGYTIDKVPAGWEIQGDNSSVLTIAPLNAKDKDPSYFAGKIAVMLQSKDQHGTPPGTLIQVGNKPAIMDATSNPPNTKILYVRQPTGIYLIVQLWDARGWTDAAIAEFAAGIHVLPNAQQGIG